MQAKGIYFSSFSFCPIQPFNRLDDAYLYWWGWSFFLSLPIQMLISSRNILTGTSKNICSLLVQSSWHIKLPIIVHVWLSLHVSNPISLWSSLFSVVSISSYAEVQSLAPAVSHWSTVTFVEKTCAKAVTHAKALHFPPQHLSASPVDWGNKGKPLPTSINSKVREKKHLGCI